MNALVRHLLLRAASIGLPLLLLAACASPPTPMAMQAAAPPATAALKTAPGSVVVTVSGGQETSSIDSPNIADADLKAAIETSLRQARAFEGIASGAPGGPAPRYALSARIVRLSKPIFGATLDVELEIAWTLLDQTQTRVLLRKAITSTGSATMSDAFVAVTRLRLAVESAARSNIEQMLRELAAVTY